ncbi:NADPH-dependent FMN reductase [Virgibacillus litoralis]|uniref:FMN reductase/FAD reductase [NAD(P)H] n=1 Tax=Virgibacillus litoralis TaxID=578221 RepID=A0ABS4H8A0_9BACI|nr:NAD(P)H-dependent oxidoreductase [Virgibacillus litoralis]MBP1947135.1 FMN reductase/FAD reductase [NAD(P)H] [Virgibacillus litoralis]
MKIVGVSGTIVGKKTSILVKAVMEEINSIDSSIETKLLDLREYDMQFSDGRSFDLYNNDTQRIIEEMSSADAYLIGSPIFNGSIPAPLKNVFDLVKPSIFRHKVMAFVANGGTYQHYLMIENQLKPIAGYLRSHVAPSYVYANCDHYTEDNKIVNTELLGRIHTLAKEIVHMQKVLKSKTTGIT